MAPGDIGVGPHIFKYMGIFAGFTDNGTFTLDAGFEDHYLFIRIGQKRIVPNDVIKVMVMNHREGPALIIRFKGNACGWAIRPIIKNKVAGLGLPGHTTPGDQWRPGPGPAAGAGAKAPIQEEVLLFLSRIFPAIGQGCPSGNNQIWAPAGMVSGRLAF